MSTKKTYILRNRNGRKDFEMKAPSLVGPPMKIFEVVRETLDALELMGEPGKEALALSPCCDCCMALLICGSDRWRLSTPAGAIIGADILSLGEWSVWEKRLKGWKK